MKANSTNATDSNPLTVIDRSASSMEIYRSDGQHMTISCDSGLVE